MPRHSTARRGGRRYYFLGLPLLLLIYFPLNRVLVARNIDCYTQFGICPHSYFEQLEPFRNVSLLRPPSSEITTRLKQFTDINRIRLYRRLPSTLVVSVSLRQPIGAVTSSVLGAAAKVADENGVVYSETSDSSLPVLILEQTPEISVGLEPGQTKALQILKSLLPLTTDRPIGRLSGETLIVSMSGLEVVLDLNRPTQSWYPSLQLILARSKITSKPPRLIDLRFTNPIIKYQ